jgi:hypothetical protein
MVTNIKCPNCGHVFEPNEAIREELQNELRNKIIEWQKKKDEEYKQRENVLLQQLQQKEMEVQQQVALEAEALKRKIGTEYEMKLNMLQTQAQEAEKQLQLAQQKELAFLQKERELKNKEAQIELQVQRTLTEERERLTEEIRKMEAQRMEQQQTAYLLRLAEYEKKMADQQKLIEQMKQKAEQGSMQLQGEVQELVLEQLLQAAFPIDKIMPVGKGVRGADCIQIVCNGFGQECGKIIYESKRTKDFSIDWIEKLKADMRSQNADIGVIVTQVFPKDMERFGEKEGIYICHFSEVKSLVSVLRPNILKVAALIKSQENKGEKMNMLYQYLTGNEFYEQWKAIREGFQQLKSNIQKERDMMEKIWKAREKQLEKVLLNAAHIKGSIEGIAGADSIHLDLPDDETGLLE